MATKPFNPKLAIIEKEKSKKGPVKKKHLPPGVETTGKGLHVSKKKKK
jgi:hypothetical protein